MVRFFILWTNRCLVYALPSGSTHKLGLENGLGCPGWKRAQAKATTSTVRSSQMLKSSFYLRSMIHLYWNFLFYFLQLFFYFLSFFFLLIFRGMEKVFSMFLVYDNCFHKNFCTQFVKGSENFEFEYQDSNTILSLSLYLFFFFGFKSNTMIISCFSCTSHF